MGVLVITGSYIIVGGGMGGWDVEREGVQLMNILMNIFLQPGWDG